MINYSTALRYDPESRYLTIKMREPKDNDGIIVRSIEAMQQHKDNLMCLSGGLDSQAHASLMIQCGMTFDVVIYANKWDREIINAADVLMAQEFCDQNKLKYTMFEVDFKSFVENEDHLQYAHDWELTSPLTAMHLHFLKELNHTGTIHMGGDVPMMYFNDRHEAKIKANSWLLLNVTFPYKLFAREHGMNIVKDIFMETPEMVYLGYKNNIDTVKKHGIYCHIAAHSGGQQRYKAAYYETVGFNVIPPMLKNTGFEHLKKHLASITGDYDEFDKRYRVPMEKIASKIDPELVKTRMTGPHAKLLTEYAHVCKNAEPISEYTFDF